MPYTAQDGSALNQTIAPRTLQPHWTQLIDTLMWSGSAVTCHTGCQHTMEMAFTTIKSVARHSARTDLTPRSANAFAFGARWRGYFAYPF